MKTINDIQFDNDYSHGTHRFLLLNDQTFEQTGPSPVIELPHALLMTFINVFRDLFQCQQHINSDNRRLVTLAIANKNINDWNNTNVNDLTLNKVYIFCDTFLSYIRMKNWDGCYRDKIQDVYSPDELDFNLLKLGIDHVFKMKREFSQDPGLRNKFCADGQRLGQALASYFQNQIDAEDPLSIQQ